MNKVHNFGDSLALSLDLNGEVDLEVVYRGIWPDYLHAVRIEGDCELQRKGVDRQLLFGNGKVLLIDEKVRLPRKDGRAPFDDFLCEEWSDLHRKKPGWTVDPAKVCDYVAYAILALGKCYVLPYEILRITCVNNLPRWKHAYPNSFRDVPNEYAGRRWTTRNWIVKWPELFASMGREMSRPLAAESLDGDEDRAA